MRFDIREFDKEKSQQELDKIFKELRGFENPFKLINIIKRDKNKSKLKRR